MMQARMLCFDTAFQRTPDLWTRKEKSRLIESILLGLPLPSFFFSERDALSGNLEIIDGLQRLCALRDFYIEKELRLEGLEFLHQYEGYNVDDFMPRDKWRMEMLQLNINIVKYDTPDEVKYNVFKRVNTGGYVLTAQEIRHALNQGQAADLVQKWAEETAFIQATAPTSFKRMADRELVTRYYSFHSLDYEGNRDLNDFLYKGMKKLGSLSTEECEQQRSLFVDVLQTAHAIFLGKAFRKPAKGNRVNPISKALFDAVTVTLAELTKEERNILVSRKNQFYSEFVHEYETSETFAQDLTTGTAQRATVQRRWTTMRNIIQRVL